MIASLLALMMIGGPALSPDLDTGVVSVGGAVVYFEDPTGQVDLDGAIELERAGSFQVVESGEPSFGFSDSSYWLHWSLAVPERPSPLLLEVGHPLLDEVDIYVREGVLASTRGSSADAMSFAFDPFGIGTMSYRYRLISKSLSTSTFGFRVASSCTCRCVSGSAMRFGERSRVRSCFRRSL